MTQKKVGRNTGVGRSGRSDALLATPRADGARRATPEEDDSAITSRPANDNTKPRATVADIRRETKVPVGEEDDRHAIDLFMALCAFYGHAFEVRGKLFADGSRNMVRLRLWAWANRDPLYAARVIITLLTAELNNLDERGEERFWGDDELLSIIYEAWSGGGILGILDALVDYINHLPPIPSADFATIQKAIELIREDLLRSLVFYSLTAQHGTIRNANGRETYRGPINQVSCLRGLLKQMNQPATVPMSNGLLQGGKYTGRQGPLSAAIQWMANRHIDQQQRDTLAPLWKQSTPGGPEWRAACDAAQRWLGNTRTRYRYKIIVYADGTKATMLLGRKSGSSTAEVRLSIVRPNGPKTFVTPHRKERIVGVSDAWIEDGWLIASSKDGIFREQLPKQPVVLEVTTGPTADPLVERRL